jgi:hypothetical protein
MTIEALHDDAEKVNERKSIAAESESLQARSVADSRIERMMKTEVELKEKQSQEEALRQADRRRQSDIQVSNTI